MLVVACSTGTQKRPYSQESFDEISSTQSSQSDETTGLASWYGQKFHRKRTASGERFDMNDFTAAHRTLPFGSKIRVWNIKTGKSVVVRVNDRGPFSKKRLIDVSYAAGRALGMLKSGVSRVRIQVLP
jgi:rare lipoprotein A